MEEISGNYKDVFYF